MKLFYFILFMILLLCNLYSYTPFTQKRDPLSGYWKSKRYNKTIRIHNNKMTGIYNCNRFFMVIYMSQGKVFTSSKHVSREYSCKHDINPSEKLFFNIVFNANRVEITSRKIFIRSEYGVLTLNKSGFIFDFFS